MRWVGLPAVLPLQASPLRARFTAHRWRVAHASTKHPCFSRDCISEGKDTQRRHPSPMTQSVSSCFLRRLSLDTRTDDDAFVYLI